MQSNDCITYPIYQFANFHCLFHPLCSSQIMTRGNNISVAANLVKIVKKLPPLQSLVSTSSAFIYMGLYCFLSFFFHLFMILSTVHIIPNKITTLSREYFKIENFLHLHDNRIASTILPLF